MTTFISTKARANSYYHISQIPDISKIMFSDKAAWGGYYKVKVIEEKWLEQGFHERIINLGSVVSIYKNLKDNYELRMRYDKSDKFFIRQMEVGRRYRQVVSSSSPSGFEIKKTIGLEVTFFRCMDYTIIYPDIN